ncbi:Perchlorate reductase subunit gamma precursor [Rubripirellula obstinata]|uniref:Perchlorate reductase subunit gamma n=1 Tax=Rubripirellula obstinata TaxID=406547 RepID=A0A5B1CKQ4_9BACT|nr:cytochrome c family protein [Rubripirellula obstinata]KAA1260912.1 Perchlorate reductase subunit gamma precursor [Rubripirellula obstinata]
MNLQRLATLFAFSTGAFLFVSAASPSVPRTVAPGVATAPNPHLVLGNDACVKCHAPEIAVWKRTPHATTFDELHRRPEAKKIAANLGLRSIKHEGRCVACHYTQKMDSRGPHVIAGVSCESCHGPAKNWVDLHHDYGGEGITRLSESPAHRASRVAKSVAAGMRNPMNVYNVAQSCLRCHTTADEELVNVGGHTAGSLDFEFVSWSQGMVLHNFVQSDGKTNRPSSPDRIRVMFVAGMIAELESSLRATAVATEKATYGVTVARRGARSVKRLQSVAAKIDSPVLNQILTVAEGVTFKLNNQAELTSAADQIAKLGHRFAEVTDGRSLESLDRFIPKTRKYQGNSIFWGG